MKEANYLKSTLIEIGLYLFILAFVFAFPLFVGLALQGFEESFVRGQALEFGSYLANFLTYTPFLIVSLLIIIFPIMKLVTLKPNQHPATTPRPAWHRIFTVSFIHAPEENGLLYRLAGGEKDFKWLKNPIKLFWYSILLFGVFGLLIIGNPQLAVSGVPQLQLQQVTVASEVSFGALVPAFAENGLILFFFMLFMGILAYFLAKNNNRSIWLFFALGFLIVILLGIMWGFFHSIVYGNSEVAFLGTIIFGILGLTITLLTGSFIPFFVFHMMNNMFLILSKVVTIKEDLLLISIMIYVVLLFLTIGIGIYRRKRKKVIYGIPN